MKIVDEMRNSQQRQFRDKTAYVGLGVKKNGGWFLPRYGSIWATLGLPKKFTPWSFESFSHFFLDFSKKKAKIFEI